jgi:uncharacterized protein (TIGR02147 family)
VKRLTRLGLLDTSNPKEWKSAQENNTTIQTPFSSEAHRRLQTQILQQAIQALEKTPFVERDQSTITLCVSERRLERAKEKIKKFRRELMQYLESGPDRDRVYQLSISLFPVSRFEKQGGKS